MGTRATCSSSRTPGRMSLKSGSMAAISGAWGTLHSTMGIPRTSRSAGGMNAYWACLRNPAWQSVLKAWVRHGVRRGVDGFIVNYFYRHNCLCEHCQTAFRRYMKDRFTAEELRAKFGIADIATHRFSEIV